MEEFLNQSEKFRSVLLEWWKCGISNLYTDKYERNKMIEFERDITHIKLLKGNKTNPPLQMHHLIRFIEDKKLFIEFNNFGFNKVKRQVCVYKGLGQTESTYFKEDESLLQTLCRVAIEIVQCQ